MKSCRARTPQNRENVKTVMKCPCPGNQNYVRKTDRPALASIQGAAPKQQYLTVDYGQKTATAVRRSRSLSACYAQCASRKPSPAAPKQAAPPAKATTKPQYPSPAAPKQATAAKGTTKPQYPSFKQPTLPLLPATVTVRPKTIANKPRSQPLAAPRRTSSTSCSKNSSCSLSNSATRIHESAQSDSGYDSFLHPSSASKHSTIRTTIQSRSSFTSNCHIYVYDCQSALQTSKSKSTENLSSILISKGCSSGTQQPKSLGDQQQQQHPHVTFSQYAQVSNTTLPEPIFYTLAQDTAGTTKCSTTATSSDVDSFISMTEKVRLIRDSSVLSEEDKSFIDGRHFFNDLDHGRCSTAKTRPVATPCSVNVPLKRSNSMSETSNVENSKMPAVKLTLKKRNTKKQIIFPLLYSPEYSEDLIEYCFSHKDNFVMRSDLVEMFVDKRARTNIVNWLIQIHGFIVPHFEPIYYMSVRLFDYAIIRLKLRKSHYQLAAIVAFWISLKYLDTTILLKVPKIYSLCGGKYSKEQILSMERTILKSIKFCLNIPDPLDFLYNYLKSSNLENDEPLKHAAKFVLECATLFESYSMANVPFVAASALYLAYKVIRKSDEVCVNFVWPDRKNVQCYVENITKRDVKHAVMEKYEPLTKYLTAEKSHVAKMFF